MVGARSLAMAPEPADRRGSTPRTRARPAASFPAGCSGRARGRVLPGVARRVPRRRLAARPGRSLAVADPGRGFVVYPYLKRFTWLCHLWLGAVDGLAPMGGWVAVTGKLPWEAWALGGAVATWVAGFDFFYSLFDDRDRPRAGAPLLGRALRRARCLPRRAADAPGDRRASVRGRARPVVDGWYWAGVAVVAGLLAYEHSLVRPNDLRRLDAAFFTMNGVISVAFFAFVFVDVLENARTVRRRGLRHQARRRASARSAS